MDPIIIRRSVVDQVANHYAANYTQEEIGRRSVRELAAVYEVSEDTARRALRIADGLLAQRGLTLTVAEGRSGWKVEPTDQERTFALTCISRLTAMSHELARYKTKAQATTHRDPDTSRAFEDCGVAIEMAVQSLSDLTV
jgi:DeoR/GlpR family transcriptional regulator of sugar metabolism